MAYPTLEQVEAADHEQLARWNRFLPSPGAAFIMKAPEKFNEALDRESKVMDRIVARLKDKGGIPPAVSKKMGW